MRKYLLMAVALLVLVGISTATQLTDQQIWQLEKLGGPWQDASKVGGMGLADRLGHIDTDGALKLSDDTAITFGSDSNFTLMYDETTDDALELAPATTGSAFTIGTASLLVNITHYGDLTLDGASASYDLVWDRSDNALEFADGTELGFGTGSSGNPDIKFVYSGGGNTLTISQEVDGTGKLVLGATGTNGLDIDILSSTSGDKITFDAGTKQLTFEDCTILVGLDDRVFFGDSTVFIVSDDDGYLDLGADTGVRINAATTVSTSLTVATTGTFTSGTGTVTLKGDVSVDAGKDISLAAGAGYIEANGETSGGIRIDPIAVGTGTTTIQNSAGTPTITLPATTCTLPGIGLTNIFTALQSTTLDDTTDGIVTCLKLTHSSSDNNATALDGAQIEFDLENATGTSTVEKWGSIDVLSTTITNGSEDADFVISLMANGAVTEAMRLDASDQSLTIGANATDADGFYQIRIYPTTASKGSLRISAVANSGDTVTTVTNAAAAAARTYTIPDSGDTASEFLMTDKTRTYFTISIGVAGEDTDGAGTNGAGMAGGAPNLTTNQFANSTGTVYVKCYDNGTTTWDDLSTSALLTAGADWAINYQLQPDADAEEAGDAFAIGFTTQFCEVCFNDLATNNGTLATYGGDCGKWQYSTGAGTWSDLTVYDGTDSTAQDGKRTLQRTGAVSFAPPSDWATATYDGQTAYWIKWVVTAAQLTQSAVIDDTNKDEPFVVIPNTDTFKAPYKCSIIRARVTNMNATLHNQSIKFVIGNFTTGTFTAEQTWTASQANDSFDLSSTPLTASQGDLIGICITDDGGAGSNPSVVLELEASYKD